MALRRALRLVASATPYVFILGAGLSIGGAAAAAAGPGGAGGQSSTVLDLNFADLDAAAQVGVASVLCVLPQTKPLRRPSQHTHTFSVRADPSFY